ncbi:hypothetical protein DIS24_g9350 [Lasiodiplodia hormozganensis]|uniref:Uncharacterized protein n=1 Tax=Lasiodiplodia hormozganensis TaxID=869390 RepID=A0AA39XW50_9PEZI|nr:hypothetical protein DIS24_g9350 [Lasiodiplodia hormozganensis]
MPANGHYYDPKMIVAISCLLANKLTIGSITGFMQSNEEGQEPSIEYIYPLQRHRELCLVLLFEKSIAEEVLRGDEQKIANLLAGPAAYALNKPEVRDSWVAGILEASRAAENSPNPVLPPPRRNASIPAYPNFDQILLSAPRDGNLDQELLYLEPSRFPPIPGEPVGWLKQNKRYLVARLYDAIRCVSEIRRHEDGINGAHFIADTGPRLSPSVDHRTLQEACWRIATAFLDGVKHGFVKPKMPNRRDERPIKPGSETIKWDHRFTLILKVLRRKKALCWRLVKSSRGLDCFLADPYGFRKLGISDADPAAAVPHA